jgi:uncharacterized protein (DUF433 family)
MKYKQNRLVLAKEKYGKEGVLAGLRLALSGASPYQIRLNSSFVFFPGRLIVSAMLDWNQCPVVERGPSKSRCMWRFKGTHVPATLLFENLEDGATVNDFLEWYPGVTREQVLAVLEFAERSLIEPGDSHLLHHKQTSPHLPL